MCASVCVKVNMQSNVSAIVRGFGNRKWVQEGYVNMRVYAKGNLKVYFTLCFSIIFLLFDRTRSLKYITYVSSHNMLFEHFARMD